MACLWAVWDGIQWIGHTLQERLRGQGIALRAITNCQIREPGAIWRHRDRLATVPLPDLAEIRAEPCTDCM